MYRTEHDPNQLELDLFFMPFGEYLDHDNRWVKMAGMISWNEYEDQYARQFSRNSGPHAKPFRMALGALIIQKRIGTSDRETVELIRESPYMQFFIGLGRFSTHPPFGVSTMSSFRKRISSEILEAVVRQLGKPG